LIIYQAGSSFNTSYMWWAMISTSGRIHAICSVDNFRMICVCRPIFKGIKGSYVLFSGGKYQIKYKLKLSPGQVDTRYYQD